ncbi:MAG TPA: hypothetical protein VIQ02_20725, partial [Jiangellaceae bacterium]
GRSASYWGDTVGVFRKRPGRQPIPIAATRVVLRWWANRVDDLEDATVAGSATGEPLSAPSMAV